MEKVNPICFKAGERQFFGVHTQNRKISLRDRENLENAKSGDIIFLHHYADALKEESMNWLKELTERILLTIIHRHKHKSMDYYINMTHVIGLGGPDPDKTIGDFISVGYLVISDKEVVLTEKVIRIPSDTFMDIRNYFGLSCVDNERDVIFATEHGLKYIELRCSGNWKPE